MSSIIKALFLPTSLSHLSYSSPPSPSSYSLLSTGSRLAVQLNSNNFLSSPFQLHLKYRREMSESTVEFVGSRLTDAGVKEVLLLYHVDKQVEMVVRELSRIQVFLKDADKKRITDQKQKQWVKEERDLAYLIEDAIHTFLSEVPPKPQIPDDMMEGKKRMMEMKRMMKMKRIQPAVYKLVGEISKIQTRMIEIEASRLRYGINTLGEGSGEITLPIRPPVLPDIDPNVVEFKEDQEQDSGEITLPIRPPVLPDIDPNVLEFKEDQEQDSGEITLDVEFKEDQEQDSEEITLPIRPPVLLDVVGFKMDQDHVVKKLLDETTKRRSVISICGVGGIGKTTLAQKVYNCNDVKRQFELHIWVAISRKFQLIDILRKIAEQLNLVINPSEQPKDVFLTKLNEYLKGRRYLIVLDDVWTDGLWAQIGAALPDEINGSRVLITTTSSNVAKDADPTCEPYKLGFLTKELSLELLLKKALPNQDPNKSSFDDLFDITNQFVRKCGVLPLALVLLGGLLSMKPCNYAAWSMVLQTMSWDTDGNECSEIIGTSYEDLSVALKSCFMYFAAFPQDYNIDAKSLLRMWVAEDFITPEDNKTLEETAEGYLEDLVQRSLVQVKSRSLDGSIEFCCIHDLLRDLVIQKANEDNFFVVDSHPEQNLSLARRVAVHHLDCDELVWNKNLRTLLCFQNKCMPNFSKLKLLKVVSCVDSTDTKINLGMLKGLTHLRYLNLIGKQSDNCEKKLLEKVIGAMKILQTLDINVQCSSELMKVLPRSAWNIKTLRHVNAPISGPPSSAKLQDLQTLASVIIKESWKKELSLFFWKSWQKLPREKTVLPHLPNLRTLELKHESTSWGVVVGLLQTLEYLISLRIYGFSIPSDIFDMRGFPFYERLKFLLLCNWFNPKTPNEIPIDVNMFPPHLTSLTIISHRFQQDVMLVLEKLPLLKNLELDEACTNLKISCSAKGFSQLEVLRLKHFNLQDWEIEEGSMPILRELTIENCPSLCVPQGLRHLTNLHKLTWCCGTGRTNEVRTLCEHVPSLIFDY